MGKEMTPESYFESLGNAIALRTVDLDVSTRELERLEALIPHGEVFTQLTKNHLLAAGLDLSPAGWVSAKYIGQYGRFGNSIGQYCLARALGRRLGLRVSIPPWIGAEVFNLPHLDFGMNNLQVAEETLIDEALDEKILIKNFDIGRYIVDFKSLESERALMREEFTFRREIPLETELRSMIRNRNKPLFVAHLRLGDVVPSEVDRIKELDLISQRLEESNVSPSEVYLITDSSTEISEQIRRFGYEMLNREILKIPKLLWLYEWTLLRVADHRLTNNPESTFFQSAEFLGYSQTN